MPRPTAGDCWMPWPEKPFANTRFAHSRGGYLLEAKKWLLGHERVI